MPNLAIDDNIFPILPGNSHPQRKGAHCSHPLPLCHRLMCNVLGLHVARARLLSDRQDTNETWELSNKLQAQSFPGSKASQHLSRACDLQTLGM